MAKVIIYTNENGNVSVTSLVDENLTIEEVQLKDCPEGSLIVDSSELPKDADDFFNAWRLVEGKVSVDLNAAKALAAEQFNDRARAAAQARQSDTLIGIKSSISDADFITRIGNVRVAILNANTLAALRTAMNGEL